jgi:hypothetical protein
MARSKEGGRPRPQKVVEEDAGGGPGRVSVRLAPEELARIDALAGLLSGKGTAKSRAEMLRQLVRRGLELLEQHPEKARALLAGTAPPEAAPRKKGRGQTREG